MNDICTICAKYDQYMATIVITVLKIPDQSRVLLGLQAQSKGRVVPRDPRTGRKAEYSGICEECTGKIMRVISDMRIDGIVRQ